MASAPPGSSTKWASSSGDIGPPWMIRLPADAADNVASQYGSTALW